MIDQAKSLPADLNDVSARLEALVKKPCSRSPSPTTTTVVDDEDYDRECQEKENEYYNALVDDGGRPPHDISLGRDITKDPGEYRRRDPVILADIL